MTPILFALAAYVASADAEPAGGPAAAAAVEAMIGAGGKLTRSPGGQVVEVVLYGESSGAARRDPKAAPRRFTDEELARLAVFADLEKLEIDGFTNITGTGFAKLAGLKKLTTLATQNPAFTEDGLAAIGTVTSLRRVSLEHTKTNVAGAVKMVAGLPDLEEIGFGVHVTDALLKAAGARPGLKKLSFIGHWSPTGDPAVTLDGYKELLKLRELTDLSIESYYADPHPKATVEIISQLPKLRRLSLVSCPRSQGKGVVAADDLAPLTKLPELENLTLAGDKVIYKIAPEALMVLKDCPKLGALTMWDVEVPTDAMPALKRAKPKLAIRMVYFGKQPDLTW